MTTHQGSFHCGRVRFEADGEIGSAMSCNCSICQRKGSLMWFVPRSALRLLTPDENAGTYLFGKHLIRHRFCAVCGIHPYAEASDRNGNPTAAINVRCLEDVDPESFAVEHFDGASR